jgi:hypothetical protein
MGEEEESNNQSWLRTDAVFELADKYVKAIVAEFQMLKTRGKLSTSSTDMIDISKRPSSKFWSWNL